MVHRIDVKTVFTFFYSCHDFYVFNVFLKKILNVFFYFKNVH